MTREQFMKKCAEVFDNIEAAEKEKCTCYVLSEDSCRYCFRMAKADKVWNQIASDINICL